MDAEVRFHQKRLGYVECCIQTRHDTDGQIVVRTCQSGSFKYHKYQDIESEVDDYMEKWPAKKNSSQRLWAAVRWASNAKKKGRLWVVKSTQKHKDQMDDTGTGNGGGRQKLKHIDGDFPWCMRRKSEHKEAINVRGFQLLGVCWPSHWENAQNNRESYEELANCGGDFNAEMGPGYGVERVSVGPHTLKEGNRRGDWLKQWMMTHVFTAFNAMYSKRFTDHLKGPRITNWLHIDQEKTYSKDA